MDLKKFAKHRSANNCPILLAIITTERDGYFGDATVISRPMHFGVLPGRAAGLMKRTENGCDSVIGGIEFVVRQAPSPPQVADRVDSQWMT